MAEDKVRVKTNDGEILEVDLDVAKQWGPINNMYEIFGTIDTTEKPVELENVNSETLKKIIEWSDHHKQDGLNVAGGDQQKKRVVDASKWDQDFLEANQEMVFDIIMAANYLGVIALLDMACKTVANMIKDKTPEQVRQKFNIPNDLPAYNTPE